MTSMERRAAETGERRETPEWVVALTVASASCVGGSLVAGWVWYCTATHGFLGFLLAVATLGLGGLAVVVGWRLFREAVK